MRSASTSAMCFVLRSVKCSIVTAGYARDADDGLTRRRDCREEPFVTDLARDVVMLYSVAKRAGHPATSRAALIHVAASRLHMASEGPMPIRAFWWQCPWKSTSGPVDFSR